MRGRTTARGGEEAVSDFHPLDRLDSHQGGGKAGVKAAVPVDVAAEPRRQAVREDLDDTAEGLAFLVRDINLGDHGVGGLTVEAAQGVGVEGDHVAGNRQRPPFRDCNAGDGDSMGDQFDAELLQERGRDGAEGYAGGGFPGAGPLQHGPGLIEAVLLHAGEVGVAGPGAGQRGVARLVGEDLRVDRVGRHDLLPLGPFRVADLDGHGAALRDPVPDAAQDGHDVLFELHPGTAAVAQAASRQGLADPGAGELNTGGHAFNNSDQCRAMGFSGSQPTQHKIHPAMSGT